MSSPRSRMTKTQVYLPKEELRALHRIARSTRRSLADLVRDAIRSRWLREFPDGPVALWQGPIEGSSTDHESAFDAP